MALTQSITLPNGATGDYIRITAYTWDRATRECSAHLHLYTSAAHAAAAPQAPLCLIAKLRLAGAKFDEYIGNAALTDTTALAQLYAAAKVEPLLAGAGFTSISFAAASDT